MRILCHIYLHIRGLNKRLAFEFRQSVMAVARSRDINIIIIYNILYYYYYYTRSYHPQRAAPKRLHFLLLIRQHASGPEVRGGDSGGV